MGRNEDTARRSANALADSDAAESVMARVRRAVESIRFGEVRVIIQDGVIVQIDRVEKERLR
jgi:hypothetical protein